MRKDDMETLVTKTPPANGRPGKAKGGASSATHKQLITRNLRLVYGEVAGEKVPDRIMDLLDQLGAAKDKSQ
ncbi:NepR family anti-sigma factor [Terricaulis sp.]|uniref:NepR family anti-sigma factor n=1 Tax=Terricaulis sp. TaxID=2768686 RepID=UPI0037837F61